MESGMLGTILLGTVTIGMGLSIYQLIAEVVARGRRAAITARQDEVLRQIYARPSPKA